MTHLKKKWGYTNPRCQVAVTSKFSSVAPPSRADFLEILEASNSCSPNGLSRPVMGLAYFTIYLHIQRKHGVTIDV